MEQCTIYSHILHFERVVQLVHSHLTEASVEHRDEGSHQTLVATMKDGFFRKPKRLTIRYRERKHPSFTLQQIDCPLSQALAGMLQFIQSLPAQNEELRQQFLYKVKSTNCELSFMAEPEITKEFEGVLRTIVDELDGFIFAQDSQFFSQGQGQHFVDKHMKVILDTNGKCDIEELEVHIDSRYHDQSPEIYTSEQIERKTRSESFLHSLGIKINEHLPCVSSSTDVRIRTMKEVIDRAYALMIVAIKGDGIEQEHLKKAVEEKRIDSFSPRESDLYQAHILTEEEKVYASWRYESLNTILWALGKINNLTYPSEVAEVQTMVDKIFYPSREEFEESVILRSIPEILDELDKTYRMNWACVDARITGQGITGNLNPSVLYERHYSLNWLTHHQNQDWDQVQTNT